MPELPEVETICNGLKPHVTNRTIRQITIRQAKLRYPITPKLAKALNNQTILQVYRRSKYLILNTTHGNIIIHLGMSGRLHYLKNPPSAQKHDHVDFLFDDSSCLRYHDPRRFGLILWTQEDPLTHRLLNTLGPEPFSNVFNADYLYAQSRKRQVSVKQFIMDNKVVVGVGNIYASESLFRAGIRPTTKAAEVSKKRYAALHQAICDTLDKAITAGGTTLKDFTQADGKPGYFQQQLLVYGREGAPCFTCNTLIKKIQQGQRSSFYCPTCQK